MISYVPNYEPGNKPYICKVFTASSGEEFHTALIFLMKQKEKRFQKKLYTNI
jgi:hypothetical protein